MSCSVMIFFADVYVQKDVQGAALKWLYLVSLVGIHLWSPRQNTSEASSKKCLRWKMSGREVQLIRYITNSQIIGKWKWFCHMINPCYKFSWCHLLVTVWWGMPVNDLFSCLFNWFKLVSDWFWQNLHNTNCLIFEKKCIAFTYRL